MKIGYVHRHYPPEGRGGICTYIATLARGLVQAGHTIHVIARAETGGDRVEEDQGVTVHRLAALSPNPTMNAVMTGVGHLVRKTTGKFATRLWAGRRIANRLEELVTQGDIDLVETAEWEAELLWYLKHSRNRVPTVVKLHGPMEIIREVNRMKADSAFECLAGWEKEMTLLADSVCSPSSHLAEEMSRRWRLDRNRIEILPYPIDSERFTPPEGIRNFDPPTILYVGRIEKNKGTDVLFSAIPDVLKKHSSTRFRIIGSDTPTGQGGGSFQRQLLKDLPAVYHAQVEWVGPKGHHELVEEYRKATLFVIPSRFDNFPNTCLEAMACGCAVVGSDTGGIREMLDEGGCGRLFSPGDSRQLADTLLDLLGDPNRIEGLGRSAREKVEREYTLKRVIESTVRYYERIAGAVRP